MPLNPNYVAYQEKKLGKKKEIQSFKIHNRYLTKGTLIIPYIIIHLKYTDYGFFVDKFETQQVTH